MRRWLPGLVILALWIAVLAYRTNGHLLAHSPFDQHTRQALAWLSGKYWLQNTPQWLEVVLQALKGVPRELVSFPPVPTLMELPWALLFGRYTPNSLVMLITTWLALLIVASVAMRAGSSPWRAWLLSLGFFWGTQIFYLSLDAQVWHQGHLYGIFFAISGLALASSGSQRYPGTRAALAGFLIALAAGCRPFDLAASAYGLYLLLATAPKERRARLAAAFAAGLAIPLAAMGWYNWLRFGEPWEFGHRYLPWSLQLPKGLFHPIYLRRNLWYAFINLNMDGRGTSLFLTAPFLVFAFASLFRKGAPRLERITALGAVSVIFLIQLFHESNGWFQFGYRYSVDVIPVLAIFAARNLMTPGTSPTWTRFAFGIAALSVLVNFYGAYWFYRLPHQ